MDAHSAIVAKRDTRSYQPRPVEAEVLDRVFNSARMAGSAKNFQPVRIITVTDPDTKAALKAGGDFASWIDEPPLLAVFTVRADAGPRRLFDVGRHAQNLMIAATAEGLASCPVTFHYQPIVRTVLNIPSDIDAPMVVSIGWPTGESTTSAVSGPRVPLSEYVMNGHWTG